MVYKRSLFQRKNAALTQASSDSSPSTLELNILTYFGSKDGIYDVLTKMSRKTLYFMKKNYRKLESNPLLRHANERVKLVFVKSIEEH